MTICPVTRLVVADESHASIPQLGAMYKGDRSRKETLVEYGFRLPSAMDNRPLRFEEWEHLTPQIIYVSATPGPMRQRHEGNRVEQVVRPTGLIDPELEVRPAITQVDDLLSEVRRVTATQERVLVTVLTKRMAEDLTDYLAEHDVRVRYLHSDIETVERSEILRDLGWVISTYWSGLICCGKDWIFQRFRWLLSWTLTRKDFCAQSVH